MKWRPIKSAPKDRLILLSCEENPEYPPYVCVGRWIDVPHTNTYIDAWRRDLSASSKQIYEMVKAKVEPHWKESHLGIMKGNGGPTYEYCGGILFHPTHWMPLPEPPRKRKR